MKKPVNLAHVGLLSLIFLCYNTGCNEVGISDSVKAAGQDEKIAESPEPKNTTPVLDTADFNKKMLLLSNNDTTGKWPAKTAYPLPGALLPYNRIIAYY